MKKIYSFSFLCVALFSQCNPNPPKCEFSYIAKLYSCYNYITFGIEDKYCAGPGSNQEITDDTKPDNFKGKCQYGLSHNMHFTREIEKCY